MSEQQISLPAGLVAVTTYGQLRHETSSCLWEMRSASEKAGLQNIQWRTIPGTLVDKARNDSVREMLRIGAGWLLFCDGDMTFAPNALHQILVTAYGLKSEADVVGAYCSLRGDLALPTIDTGTGTWESWFPNSGIVEVIRTGAAFVLIKRHVFEALKDPWYRMRVPARPVDFMAEVDNFARIKFDGKNPFRNTPEQFWERLEKCARDDPSSAAETFVPAEVGEDSGFCDRVRNAGFRIVVNTDIVTGHVDTEIRDWRSHKKAITEMERTNLHCVGVEV